ncbi:MAG: O-antigen ligase family protein [Yoonia sp.]
MQNSAASISGHERKDLLVGSQKVMMGRVETMDHRGSPILFGLLALVVLSSVSLLVFGLDPAPGPFVFLHIPTVIAQVVFTLGVFLRRDCRAALSGLTQTQQILLSAVVVYIVAVSYLSPIETAPFLANFWVIHVAFFLALLCYYRTVVMDGADPVWTVFAIATAIHVAAFLLAVFIWTETIRVRTLPAFEHVRFLGYFVAPAAAGMAMYFVTRHERLALPLLGFTAGTFYIIYTGSRGGAVAIVAGLVIGAAYVGFMRQKIYVSRVVILLCLVATGVYVAGLLPRLPLPPLFDRAVAVVDQTNTELMSNRNLLWADLVTVIKERWLLGYGPVFVTHAFSFAIDPSELRYDSPDVRNTHNLPLQLLMNWGVLGTVLMIATACTFLRNIRTALTQRLDLALVPATVLVTMLVHSLVSGVFFYPYTIVIGIIAFASLEGIGWRARK